MRRTTSPAHAHDSTHTLILYRLSTEGRPRRPNLRGPPRSTHDANATSQVQAVIQKSENGKSALPRCMPQLAEALGLPPEWLLCGIVGDEADPGEALAKGLTKGV